MPAPDPNARAHAANLRRRAADNPWLYLGLTVGCTWLFWVPVAWNVLGALTGALLGEPLPSLGPASGRGAGPPSRP